MIMNRRLGNELLPHIYWGKASRKLQLARILDEGEVIQSGNALYELIHPQGHCWALQVF